MGSIPYYIVVMSNRQDVEMVWSDNITVVKMMELNGRDLVDVIRSLERKVDEDNVKLYKSDGVTVSVSKILKHLQGVSKYIDCDSYRAGTQLREISEWQKRARFIKNVEGLKDKIGQIEVNSDGGKDIDGITPSPSL